MSLKDENAVLSAICWKGVALKLPFDVEDGLEVICTGKITTYAGMSRYQLTIESMEPAGVGALMALLEKRKKQLAKEGLFDPSRKKKIPFLPTQIGVITSPTGAVIQDILHRLQERFPVHVKLWPVLVQGDKAAEQIADAINGFNKMQDKPDLLIVARGGGSIEDLWCFNEEIVVRAAAASEIPLISAVGHETDTTLIDYAADLRAPTPTAAAELAVPVRAELMATTDDLGRRNKGAITRVFEEKYGILSGLVRGLPRPGQILEEKTQKLDGIIMRLSSALPNFFEAKSNILTGLSRGLPKPSQIIHEKQQALANSSNRLLKSIPNLLELRHKQLAAIYLKNPKQLIEICEIRLRNSSNYLQLAFNNLIKNNEQKLHLNIKLLDSFHYKRVLERGFALVRNKNGLITSSANIMPGESVKIEFADGKKDVITTGSKPKKTKKIQSDNQGSLF